MKNNNWLKSEEKVQKTIKALKEEKNNVVAKLVEQAFAGKCDTQMIIVLDMFNRAIYELQGVIDDIQHENSVRRLSK